MDPELAFYIRSWQDACQDYSRMKNDGKERKMAARKDRWRAAHRLLTYTRTMDLPGEERVADA